MGNIIYLRKGDINMEKRYNDILENSRKYGLKEVDQTVEKIILESGIKTIPIDVKKIAEELGFSLSEVDFRENLSGVMVYKRNEFFEGKKKVILVSKNQTDEEKVFTIAHEIGHYFLHCKKGEEFYERRQLRGYESNLSDDDKRLEDEADYFAASLLMPCKQFIDYFKMIKSSYQFLFSGDELKEKVIKKVAYQFYVDEEAVNRRIVEVFTYFE